MEPSAGACAEGVPTCTVTLQDTSVLPHFTSDEPKLVDEYTSSQDKENKAFHVIM
jgi:hypothetical protein